MGNKAVAYARAVVDGTLADARGRPAPAAEYVVKQCREFLAIAEGRSDSYVIDERRVRQVEGILKLLVMPKGLKAGQSLYECTLGYQWLFYVAVFCTVHRDEPERRRYETAVLEICRKNFKTYTCGTAFIISFLLEPPFSKFFSVAPDGALSREVRDAISETLKSSPKVYRRKGRPRFRILRDYIMFSPTESKYVPLNYATNRFDGRLPNVFLADEVGALPNNSAIEAMRSGQLNVLNKLGCVVSTKYPTIDNPLEDEVAYAKRVLDGAEDDETVFADATWLSFIVGQVLANAAKYGASCVRFSSRTEGEGGAARTVLAMADDGCGIPAADVPRVFERGFTGANGRAQGSSTGMGLYLAAVMCEKMGLGLGIASEEGTGTRVMISFPHDRRRLDVQSA